MLLDHFRYFVKSLLFSVTINLKGCLHDLSLPGQHGRKENFNALTKVAN